MPSLLSGVFRDAHNFVLFYLGNNKIPEAVLRGAEPNVVEGRCAAAAPFPVVSACPSPYA